MSKKPKPTFDQHTAAMQKLERELAYSAARCDIECECVGVDLPNGNWWDVSKVNPLSVDAHDDGRTSASRRTLENHG
mgnify:CR=1 FL=1